MPDWLHMYNLVHLGILLVFASFPRAALSVKDNAVMKEKFLFGSFDLTCSRIRTQDCWMGSANVTSVICLPPLNAIYWTPQRESRHSTRIHYAILSTSVVEWGALTCWEQFLFCANESRSALLARIWQTRLSTLTLDPTLTLISRSRRQLICSVPVLALLSKTCFRSKSDKNVNLMIERR